MSLYNWDRKSRQAAFDTGQLIEKLVAGYYGHLAATIIATDVRAVSMAPAIETGQNVPVGRVFRNDQTSHTFHFLHYLKTLKTDPAIEETLSRVWLSGVLITAGDLLSKNRYFDRAPEFELVRHLRNGIAHGNTFRIDSVKNLIEFPAHNIFAAVRSDTHADFIVDESIQGLPVLFDFMGEGDILDLLLSVGLRLIQLGSIESKAIEKTEHNI